MSLFSYDNLVKDYDHHKSYDYLRESKGFAKAESIQVNDSDQFDIFLSHSYADRKVIPVLKETLESIGLKVYVDWIDDKLLSRDNVTKETAEILQKRMKQSRSLIFATSENSPSSKWMPWELGYFDGIKNKRVAILPIKTKDNNFKDDYKGQEYLGLYYYVSIDTAMKYIMGKVWGMERNAFNRMVDDAKKQVWLFVNGEDGKYVSFKEWLDGQEPEKSEIDIVMNLQ